MATPAAVRDLEGRVALATGAMLYAGRLVADNDRIVLLHEYLDLVKSARAVLPDGTADIPA